MVAASLYAIYQRTQSESKSQHHGERASAFILCTQSIKEHNLKANHNYSDYGVKFRCLYAIYQRTQSESKSQLVLKGAGPVVLCTQSIKEHNLKANHNYR